MTAPIRSELHTGSLVGWRVGVSRYDYRHNVITHDTAVYPDDVDIDIGPIHASGPEYTSLI
jgi:hypothetical protein